MAVVHVSRELASKLNEFAYAKRMSWSEVVANALNAYMERCHEQYGSNPDRCYLLKTHRGPHSNKYGTTWPKEQQ